MVSYLVTGGTGFLGRHVVARLASRPDAEVHVLVRRESLGKFEALAETMPGRNRLGSLIGDLTAPGRGLAPDAVP
ncbi:NAD-dependent epimerase/dehydratase family protein, partial [Rhodococcus chondri]